MKVLHNTPPPSPAPPRPPAALHGLPEALHFNSTTVFLTLLFFCGFLGERFSLVANFLKRHFNLRCIVKQRYGDLRVFPERYVVCASCPEDASALSGNPSPAASEQKEQSRSEYFSRVGETQEPLNSSTKTKKTALQKIAKQASVQRERCGSSTGERLMDQRAWPRNQRGEHRESELSPKETESSSEEKAADHQEPVPRALNEAGAQSVKRGQTREQQTESSPPDRPDPRGASLASCQHAISQETSRSKRSKPSDPGEEDPHPQKAKMTCPGRPPAATQTPYNKGSTQTPKHDPPPLQPLPPADAESKALPVSEHSKTTVEVELLTPGKRAQSPPLTSNNTAQTNQNRLPASLRGLSVKPASSGSSISSRSTLAEEGSKNVPRTSRLRRQKRS
ncbi:protein SLX4IP-like [Labrus mixtus]|uniref:protein SLX4IP-like n=1 Tax=Labrus mixtus TaxID=508554 RepID=UPI0029C02519|nr:protein SLX4IP-like [Labrus mixtus]